MLKMASFYMRSHASFIPLQPDNTHLG